jgi:glucose/arabinose dehydrogenase
VARYTRSSNSDVADATTEKIILNQPKPFDNHNGGSIHFAPDGYLWIVTGDGGSGGDPNNNGQNKNSLLGKLLRLDINSTGPYNIPPDNPFVGTDGADEVWAYGLRNAWKFNFDTVSGNVMIADVGQGNIEEINRMPITQAGLNYGWRCYEGNSTYNTSGCAAQSTMTFPVAAYDHSGGRCSITGGYVYRGSLYPALQGKYIFADYCSRQIGILNSDDSITWSAAFSGNNFSTFGINNQNELFVAAVNNGKIFRVTTSTLSTNENNLSAQIKIHPNPASKKVFIEGIEGKNTTIDITNTEGRKVLEGAKIESDHSLNISGIPTGLYFLHINMENQKAYSKKLIVK